MDINKRIQYLLEKHFKPGGIISISEEEELYNLIKKAPTTQVPCVICKDYSLWFAHHCADHLIWFLKNDTRRTSDMMEMFNFNTNFNT